MKVLSVGDPHTRVQDIPECEKLLDRVEAVADEAGIDHNTGFIVLMGDLFHNHSIMHVEVMHFWRRRLERLVKKCWVYILLGNHDGPQDAQQGVHALAALEMKGVTIVDKPTQMCLGPQPQKDGSWKKFPILYGVPFMRSNDDFIQAMKVIGEMNDTPPYCHQEFNGCRYDLLNHDGKAYYSKTGVDPEAIPQKLVISGHIHTGQEFGKVWYVGAPRWMTASDVNQDRFVWVIEHDDLTGQITKRTPYPTDPACQRLVQVEDTEAAPADPAKFPEGAAVMVDIKGSAAWILERKTFWHGRARVRTFATNERQSVVKESDGIAVAFKKFLGAYLPKFGVPIPALEKISHDRLGI